MCPMSLMQKIGAGLMVLGILLMLSPLAGYPPLAMVGITLPGGWEVTIGGISKESAVTIGVGAVVFIGGMWMITKKE